MHNAPSNEEPKRRIVRNLSEEVASPFHNDLNTSWRDTQNAKAVEVQAAEPDSEPGAKPSEALSESMLTVQSIEHDKRTELSEEASSGTVKSKKGSAFFVTSPLPLSVICTVGAGLQLAAGKPGMAALHMLTAAAWFAAAYAERKRS